MITLFEEVGEPSRRALLVEMLSGPKTVTELCKATGLKQANVSNHLARLRRKHIVQREKRGREAFYRIASPEMTEAVANMVPSSAERSDTLDLMALSELYVHAGLRGDEYTCAKIVDRTIRAGLTLVSIDEDILGAAVVTAAAMLARRECDEAQEHLLSFITERMIARVAMVRQSFVRLDRMALLASAPGNIHSLGLRMVSDYLKSCGWRTAYLGLPVPLPSFARQIEEHQPDLVLVEIRSHEGGPEAMQMVEEAAGFRKRGLRCAIGCSGPGAGENSRGFHASGADFVAHSLREFAYEILPNLDLPVRALPSSRYLR